MQRTEERRRVPAQPIEEGIPETHAAESILTTTHLAKSTWVGKTKASLPLPNKYARKSNLNIKDVLFTLLCIHTHTHRIT